MSGVDVLVERMRELEADFRGCGDHSRHKQAAEAWHYCADQIAAALANVGAQP